MLLTILVVLGANGHWAVGCGYKGSQFSAGRGISSQAAEFALFRGILILPQNFAEFYRN